MLNYEDDIISLSLYDKLVEQTRYNWDNRNSFLEYFLHSYTRIYRNHMLSLPNGSYVKQQILLKEENYKISIELNAKICEVVKNYLHGKPHIAYDLMKESFDLMKDILLRKSNRLAGKSEQQGKFIFRARVQRDGDAPPTLRKDMFHIPFEKRHLVSGQRFSIHGIPSVYLGESVYDCYLELGKPDVNKLWVSLFHVPIGSKPTSCSIVDLTFAYNQHTASLLINKVKKKNEAYFTDLDKLVDDILLWPLIMACSIVCKFPDAPFKQEYIVPQILFHLCNDITGFAGIRYYSTKLDGTNRKNLQSSMVNYAFPAQVIKDLGFCPYLSNKLSLTKPVSIQTIQDIPIKSEHLGGYTKMGLPLISEKDENLKKDKAVLALDKLTMYFDQLMHKQMLQTNISEIAPVWK